MLRFVDSNYPRENSNSIKWKFTEELSNSYGAYSAAIRFTCNWIYKLETIPALIQ